MQAASWPGPKPLVGGGRGGAEAAEIEEVSAQSHYLSNQDNDHAVLLLLLGELRDQRVECVRQVGVHLPLHAGDSHHDGHCQSQEGAFLEVVTPEKQTGHCTLPFSCLGCCAAPPQGNGLVRDRPAETQAKSPNEPSEQDPLFLMRACWPENRRH